MAPSQVAASQVAIIGATTSWPVPPSRQQLMQRLRQASAKPVRITGPVELGPSAAMGEVAAVETTNATTPSDMDMDEAASSSAQSMALEAGRQASRK